MGGDVELGNPDRITLVSIHAPAWGATGYRLTLSLRLRGFNPRPRMGGDAVGRGRFKEVFAFQSTPPHGGRHHAPAATPCVLKFQSTPPHGGRHERRYEAILNGLFQSTPPHGGRGLTQGRLFVFGRRNVSIHAPAWGATRRADRSRQERTGFNPRPRMGGDRLWQRQHSHLRSFNPRPRMGGDLRSSSDARLLICFNPRPRMGGDKRRHGYPRAKQVSIHAPAWGATDDH